MKKTIKLAVVAALALGATSAFATNGSNLIATGAKARAMGGTDIGIAHGAESGLANAALITTVEGTEISFGGTLFMPDVQTDAGNGAGYKSSDADMSMIPEVAIASKLSESLYIGVGMWGTAGMGVDYRDEAANMHMVTNLQLMQFGVPIAYKVKGVSLSVTPVLQYGSLDINYANDAAGTTSTTQGVAQDLEFGYNLGAAYTIKGITLGAMYKSQIDMEYKGQISQAMSDFTGAPASAFSDKLSTPAEIGLGLSYTTKEHTIAFDYKQIKWSDAKGYEDFAWDDQDVYAIGYEYAKNNWAVRLGYNYADSPISEQPAGGGELINEFNLLGFPAIITSHMTLGGSYTLSKQTSVDLAYVYAPEVTETYANTGYSATGEISTKHSQQSVSVQMNFDF